MHIALATCENLPDWEVDDRPLHEAFETRGVVLERPIWSDPHIVWSNYDACLIRTTWDYQERRSEYLAWIEHVSCATRLFNPAPIVRWNTHKSYLRDLESRGVRVAPTVWLLAGQRANLGEIVEPLGWERAFLKPAIGATARETMRFSADDADQLARAQQHVDRLLRAEDVLLQPYLVSVETLGELSAVFIDGEITHTVRKIPVPGDYRVQDDYGADDEPYAFSEHELETARRAVEAVEGHEDLLYARTDFLRDDEGQLCLGELELVEPSLFFRHGPHAAERLADALLARVGNTTESRT
jgi:glutathione synthase/RimK-type ligase-like ATP-grasp enzyme